MAIRLLNYLKKIKVLGFKKVIFNSLYNRVNRWLTIFFARIFSIVKIKDTIVFESHNDFDCNCGAFYNYLIEKGINDKYKIVWLIKNEYIGELPNNVQTLKLKKISLKKYFYLGTSKFLFSEESYLESYRKDQVAIYCTHGGVTIKNVVGLIVVPSHIDYILSSSRRYDAIMCRNYSIPYPNDRMIHFGYPSNDVFFDENEQNEFLKFNSNYFDKYILWMPTFRKGGGDLRNDSTVEYPFDIPLLENISQVEKLNSFLKENNTLLTIKIHPMQVIERLMLLSGFSNINILTGNDMKKYGLDNYRLMKSSQALISDYSSASYSFIMLDRPIGFMISDINEYKAGFIIKDIDKYMPGKKINDYSSLESFIKDIAYGVDPFKNERRSLASELYEYQDGNSCKRLSEFLELEEMRK